MRRPRHVAVIGVLADLEADLLRSHRCLFGGGTRLTLELDEYRVSADIDFLVSDAAGYAELRALVRRSGAAVLFRAGTHLAFPREAVTDQYGVRFPIGLPGGDVLKFEIVREARIELGAGVRPRWAAVECLGLADAAAEKLLANSDRWLDTSTLSRDLLDLAAIRVAEGRPISAEALEKSVGAYGASVITDVARAARAFLSDERAAHRRRCFEGLEVEAPERLLEGVRLLAADVDRA